jgi:peptidoglycan/LPS O-acetylase OafA/YrhL
MTREANEYRHDVDGLRAIAVLAVVAFHARVPFTEGGFVGVDVFFVISGYLITGLLVKEAGRTGDVSLGDFYARRVRRLLPALTATGIGVLLLGALFLVPWGEQQRLAWSALAMAAFASNIFFWSSSGNYFAGPVEREPLLHTWSLAVEEQFYLVWPLLVLASYRLAQRLGRSFASLLTATLSVSFGLSLYFCIGRTLEGDSGAFYLMPYRAWEFALGGLLSLRAFSDLDKRGATVVAWLGLGAIVGSVLLFDSEMAFPGAAALVPTLGTGALLIAGGQDHGLRRILTTRGLARVGQWSYSWYLWHWPLIVTGRAANLGQPDLGRDLSLSLVALGLAALTYHLVENPIRFGRPGPFRERRSTLVAGLAMSVLLAVTGASLGLHARHALRTTEPYRSLLSQVAADAPRDCSKSDQDCVPGDWGRRPGVVVWGDSHAARLANLPEGIPVLERTHSNCPPLLGGVVPTREGGLPGVRCGAFNERVMEEVDRRVARGEVAGVLLAARWSFYVSERPPSGQAPRTLVQVDAREGPGSLEIGLAATLDRLRLARLTVAIVAPLPEHRFDVPLCLSRRAPRACETPRERADEYREPALARLRAVVTGRHDVRLLDGFDDLCSGPACAATDSAGRLLFIDEHHIGSAALDILRPRWAPDLAWLAFGVIEEQATSAVSTRLLPAPAVAAGPAMR